MLTFCKLAINPVRRLIQMSLVYFALSLAELVAALCKVMMHCMNAVALPTRHPSRKCI